MRSVPTLRRGDRQRRGLCSRVDCVLQKSVERRRLREASSQTRGRERGPSEENGSVSHSRDRASLRAIAPRTSTWRQSHGGVNDPGVERRRGSHDRRKVVRVEEAVAFHEATAQAVAFHEATVEATLASRGARVRADGTLAGIEGRQDHQRLGSGFSREGKHASLRNAGPPKRIGRRENAHPPAPRRGFPSDGRWKPTRRGCSSSMFGKQKSARCIGHHARRGV